MKNWNCDACGTEIEVYDEYEPEFCCAGRMEDACACMGRPINPMLCDECEVKIFGKKKKCDICKHKTTMSEAELYCADRSWGLGQVFDWCGAFNDSLELAEDQGFDFDNCPKYESKEN